MKKTAQESEATRQKRNNRQNISAKRVRYNNIIKG